MVITLMIDDSNAEKFVGRSISTFDSADAMTACKYVIPVTAIITKGTVYAIWNAASCAVAPYCCDSFLMKINPMIEFAILWSEYIPVLIKSCLMHSSGIIRLLLMLL